MNAQSLRVSRRRLFGAKVFFGRKAEQAELNRAWEEPACGVVVIVAEGGAGKTALAAEWRSKRIAAAKAEGEGLVVFEWSFYSQGTRDHGGSSADPFVRDALVFFGDEALAKSAASQEKKGERIAELVEAQRALLILDGLEPLQRHDGSLREPGIVSLLDRLAMLGCAGLCVVTTRVRVKELEGCSASAVVWRELVRLDEKSGSALLRHLLEDGDRPGPVVSEAEDRRAIWEAVQGHALTLQLTGSYIRRALRDVRRWEEIDFRRADDAVMGGHAFRVMDAYVRWLSGEVEEPGLVARVLGALGLRGREYSEGEKLVAALRMLGLFDRGADPGCVAKLREAPAIPGVTEAIAGLDDLGWEGVISALEEMRLVGRAPFVVAPIVGYDEDRARAAGRLGRPEGEPAPWSGRVVEGEVLEAHPLVREYFARVVREESPEGWREGHGRLFEYLCDSVPYWPEGTEGLQPLYQAVVHGGAAGWEAEARAGVYRDRILRGARAYSTKQLGAISADLAAVACLFESPWDRPSTALDEAAQSWLLNEAAFSLRALGRLGEALAPMRAGLERDVEREDWKNAAVGASNLSQLELTLGHTQAAVASARQAVAHANRSGDEFLRLATRAALADARHQAGDLEAPTRTSRRPRPCRPSGSRPTPYSTPSRVTSTVTCCSTRPSARPGAGSPRPASRASTSNNAPKSSPERPARSPGSPKPDGCSTSPSTTSRSAARPSTPPSCAPMSRHPLRPPSR